MPPREIGYVPNWIVLGLFLASICFVYSIFGWIGVSLMCVVVAVVVSLLIMLIRRR